MPKGAGPGEKMRLSPLYPTSALPLLAQENTYLAQKYPKNLITRASSTKSLLDGQRMLRHPPQQAPILKLAKKNKFTNNLLCSTHILSERLMLQNDIFEIKQIFGQPRVPGSLLS